MIEKSLNSDFYQPDLKPEQKSQAEVGYYLNLLDIFNKASKRYAVRKLSGRDSLEYKGEGAELLLDLKRDLISTRALIALEELNFSVSKEDFDLEQFKNKWGEEASVYQEMLKKLRPSIDQTREEALKKASNWNPRETLSLVLQAGSVLPSLNFEQRERFLVMAGFDPQEITKLLPKIALSGTMSFGIAALYEGIGYTAAGYGALNPFAGELTNSQTILTVLGSYALYYSSLLLNADKNLKLLQNERIGTSPAISATIGYYLLKKFLPSEQSVNTEREQNNLDSSKNPLSKALRRLTGRILKNPKSIQEWGTRVASLALEPTKEIGWAATVLIPGIGPSMIIAANLAGFALNTLQALLADATILLENKFRRKN